MRTTLELDDELMTALLARHPGVSKRRAVETAIRSYLREDAADRLRALAGGFPIKDVSAEMRRVDRRT
jgi:Arc/MetJ family transcription regulator